MIKIKDYMFCIFKIGSIFGVISDLCSNMLSVLICINIEEGT